MKYTLILLETPIITSDEEIMEGDNFIISSTLNTSFFSVLIANKKDEKVLDGRLKVIAGIPGLPQIDYNGFEERLGIIDIEKLALEKYLFPFDAFTKMKKCSQNDYLLEEEFGLDLTTKYREILGFIEGFKKAQSLGDKRFSEDDMLGAYNQGGNDGAIYESACGEHDSYEQMEEAQQEAEQSEKEFIQSLRQPKVFDVEVEIYEIDECSEGENCKKSDLKCEQ